MGEPTRQAGGPRRPLLATTLALALVLGTLAPAGPLRPGTAATDGLYDTTARLMVSPTTVAAAGTVTATWEGISSPTATDWIGLYTPATGDHAYLQDTWLYVSCSKTATAAAAAGSCRLALPATIPAGTYQLRLLSDDGYSRLATSQNFTLIDSSTAPVLVGAGDIASCASDGDEATAALLDGIVGTVFTVGDHAYDSGAPAEFADCYAPTWGRHTARTRPAPGNHEYHTPGAAGYFGYFGAAAGDPARGYYSYDLGTWHIVVLNSNCAAVGGCGAGSVQERWLRDDLAAHPAACTLAYWHHPRFSSGWHGSDSTYQAFWQALYDYRADVVLTGHDHSYERFGRQDPAGNADANGIREFVVGTGGKDLRRLPGAGGWAANSRVSNDTTFGVLMLTLHADSYAWQFVPQAGGTFTDSGRDTCHGATPSGASRFARN